MAESYLYKQAHLPILALLSFTHYYPPTFPGFHHPCHCNTILFSYSVPRPFLPSIAGCPITIALSHLAFSQVEAACVRDYHTFVWSSVPESATDGSPVHASVQFQGTRGDRELGGRSQVGQRFGKRKWAQKHKARHREQGKISSKKISEDMELSQNQGLRGGRICAVQLIPPPTERRGNWWVGKREKWCHILRRRWSLDSKRPGFKSQL